MKKEENKKKSFWLIDLINTQYQCRLFLEENETACSLAEKFLSYVRLGGYKSRFVSVREEKQGSKKRYFTKMEDELFEIGT